MVLSSLKRMEPAESRPCLGDSDVMRVLNYRWVDRTWREKVPRDDLWGVRKGVEGRPGKDGVRGWDEASPSSR